MRNYHAYTPKNCSRGSPGLITISYLGVKLSPIGQLVAWFDEKEFQSPDGSNCNFTCWQLLCPTQSLSTNSAADNWILTALNEINGGIASLVKSLNLFQASSPFLYTLILMSCPHVCVCKWGQECCPLFWTHWVRSLLWPVSCSKWRVQRLKAAVELRMWLLWWHTWYVQCLPLNSALPYAWGFISPNFREPNPI